MQSGLFQEFQPIAAIAPTPAAVKVLRPLCDAGVVLWVPEEIHPDIDLPEAQVKRYTDGIKDYLPGIWETHRSVIFGMAAGAVTRLIAPLLQDKATDPAVVVVDGAGQFVVSLCGGHQGGADRLTQVIAAYIGATAVLTGGANALSLTGIDVLGAPFGWRKGSGDWTGVSAAIARGEPVQVIQEVGSELWQSCLPAEHSLQFGFPDIPGEPSLPAPKARVWITPIQRRFFSGSEMPKAQWHPRVLWVGIGCERGTPRSVIEAAIRQVFRSNHLAEEAIAGIATIDIKSDEPGLVELCRDRQYPLRCFPSQALRRVPVPTPSSVVEQEVGTPSVAEAAAILASKPDERLRLADSDPLLPPAPPLPPTPHRALRVPKRVVRLEGQPGAVTVAVAQARQEYTGRTGALWLVGTGPGQLDQITPAARTAIAQADAVIGYSLYMEMIQPLLRPGQIIEALPITQERQRAERAIELAFWGLTVVVVSSGDCGIYGMAGLVLEQLRSQEWDGKTPAVQVFPGITALQAAASRVGAPLMHDFCAISLSDLLTPWEVIQRRLTAAAQADFVTALYNPRSKTRTEQLAMAQEIFLQYRHGNTPVALVRSAYRSDEQITLTTLEDLLTHPVDMLTTVLIGNQSSRLFEGWMITPRGYLGFEEPV